MKKLTTKEFISKALAVHGERYDYSRTKYSGALETVEILCREHGVFLQVASRHAAGCGCPRCGTELTATLKKASASARFASKAATIHSSKYDYTHATYVNAHTPLEIVCPHHGSFMQKPLVHLQGSGCPQCGYAAISQSKLSDKASFILKARGVHGDCYDYSLVEYTRAIANVQIACKKHGPFWQAGHAHLAGSGCPRCAAERQDGPPKKDQAWFLSRCEEVHGTKYDYSSTKYEGSPAFVEITCAKHGGFWQTATNHLQGKGCPRCGTSVSKGEQAIADFISSLGVEIVQQWSQIKGFKVDIFIPSANLAVEYCGLYFHGERFADENAHVERMRLMEKQGVRTLFVFEDEWLAKKDVVKKTIRSTLGLNDRVGARSTTLVRPTWSDVKAFLEENHLQGAGISRGMNYGLESGGELVAVMTFGPSRFGTGDWEMLRFASSLNVVGGFTKLLKAFRREHVGSLFSFSDNRWFSGGVYQRAGFVNLGVSNPGYFWCRGTDRHPRYRFQKHKLRGLFPDCDPDRQTEVEIMSARGYHRIWDCGQTRWLLPANQA